MPHNYRIYLCTVIIIRNNKCNTIVVVMALSIANLRHPVYICISIVIRNTNSNTTIVFMAISIANLNLIDMDAEHNANISFIASIVHLSSMYCFTLPQSSSDSLLKFFWSKSYFPYITCQELPVGMASNTAFKSSRFPSSISFLGPGFELETTNDWNPW